ncbi:MAG: recombination mediator RecR [Candidatus Magasanikbacteria bacterium]|nr:recombination mediator RecR [Candidatus Magasanikbacteria bacterium]
MFSPSINQLIDALKKLPSVGEHTAQRYVFHWLRSGKGEVNELKEALDNLLKNTKSCSVCWNFSDTNPCTICTNDKRDHNQICVVAEVPDIAALEKTSAYSGVYHVLRGSIDGGDLDHMSELKIKELLKRVEQNKDLQEVVLALSPDMSGETTMLYLKKEILNLNPKIRITRLARGLPMGSDLQYADEITLGSALKNRV